MFSMIERKYLFSYFSFTLSKQNILFAEVLCPTWNTILFELWRIHYLKWYLKYFLYKYHSTLIRAQDRSIRS